MNTLQFLGAAQTVTGSKYLLRCNSRNILVDCGLFQGVKSLRLKNWEAFPIPPSEIDAVLLTHAHLDHAGYIPRFIKNGFRGKIYSTPATRDLCEILLPDAGYLAEEEAAFLNRHKKTKHQPALPLYTFADAKKALDHFVSVPFDENFDLGNDFSFRFQYAGHILGAASILVNTGEIKIGFSGDLGRIEDDILFPPRPLGEVDYLVVESTYGNRLHECRSPEEDIAKIVTRTVKRGGTVVIPSFAVGRAQTILYYLWKLKNERGIPDVPIYLNSPMSTNVNEVWTRHHELHRLTNDECKDVCDSAIYVRTVEESKALNENNAPKIIISASGMMTGGRVLHHVKKLAPDERNTIVLAGFQSAGTRGEAIQNGAKEIKIHGEYIPIRSEVATLQNISAHADYRELIEIFKNSNAHPRSVFITHGEAAAADELRRRFAEAFGWNCAVPEMNEKVELR